MFSDVFKTARKETGLSQARLSVLTEIPRRTIESWEMGVSSPPKWVQRLVLAELKRLTEKQEF